MTLILKITEKINDWDFFPPPRLSPFLDAAYISGL